MKKTISTNLNGLLFNLDEDAYEKLHDYLSALKRHFRGMKGHSDVMDDIEERISEMFQERIKDRKEVITLIDVQHVIGLMGEPEVIAQEAFDEDSRESFSNSHHSEEPYEPGTRRLYRDKDNAVVGGVCAGVANYFGIDPILLRLAFIIAVVFFGTGILLYLILLVIIPKATTTAQKLQMKGKKVTVENIRKVVEDEAENFKKKISDIDGKPLSNRIATIFEKSGKFLLALLERLGNFIAKTFGTLLIVGGSVLFVIFTLMVLGVSDFQVGFFEANYNYENMTISELKDMFIHSTEHYYGLLFGTFLTFTIPSLAMVLLGSRIVTGKSLINTAGSIGLFGLWAVGLITMVLSTFYISSSYSSDGATITDYKTTTTSDTLSVRINNAAYPIALKGAYEKEFIGDFGMHIKPEDVYMSHVNFDVQLSPNDSLYVRLLKKSNGPDQSTADLLSSTIDYSLSVDSLFIELNGFLRFDKSDQFYNQQVKVIVYLPKGKTLYFDKSIRPFIDDIQNVQGMYDPKMAGKYWTMTDNGLSCLSCAESFKDAERNTQVSKNIRELKREIRLLKKNILKEVHQENKELQKDLKELEVDLQNLIDE